MGENSNHSSAVCPALSGALSQDDVAAVLAELLEEQISTQRKRLERRGGVTRGAREERRIELSFSAVKQGRALSQVFFACSPHRRRLLLAPVEPLEAAVVARVGRPLGGKVKGEEVSRKVRAACGSHRSYFVSTSPRISVFSVSVRENGMTILIPPYESPTGGDRSRAGRLQRLPRLAAG